MKKLRILLAGLCIAAGLAAAPAVYAADTATEQSVCEGIGLTDSSGNCQGTTGTQTVDNLLVTIISLLSLIVGIAAVIMVIVGGLKYVTSGGDSNAIGSAKKTVTYAVVGLLIAVTAQVIIRFVLKSATTTTPTPMSPVPPGAFLQVPQLIANLSITGIFK